VAADQQGKRSPLQAATLPLLQFDASIPTKQHTFEFVKTSLQVLRDQGHRPPKVANTKSQSFCFPFLLKGLGCSCGSQRLKLYAHVDTATWKKESLAELQTFLAIPAVAAIFTMTEPVKTFLGP
jgi:hypothetical protein